MISLAIACLLAAASADDPPPAPPKPDPSEGRRLAREDLARLQGTWSCRVTESRGMQTRTSGIEATADYLGDALTLRQAGQPYRTAIITLDPARTPKAMDSRALDGPNKDGTRVGIYKIDGDTLTICFGPIGGPRPERFTTEGDSRNILFIYDRVKP